MSDTYQQLAMFHCNVSIALQVAEKIASCNSTLSLKMNWYVVCSPTTVTEFEMTSNGLAQYWTQTPIL